MSNPITVAGSVVASKYDKGVILASDKAINYGSTFKFSNVSHFVSLNKTTIIGASGEFADFQQLVSTLKTIISQERCKGRILTPKEIHTFIKRVMYQRRSKINPIMAKIIVAGIESDGKAYLGCTDPHGTSWEDDAIATGLGSHMKGVVLENIANRSKDEVQNGIRQLFVAISGREAAFNGPVEFVVVSAEGISFEQPVLIQAGWDIIDEVW